MPATSGSGAFPVVGTPPQGVAAAGAFASDVPSRRSRPEAPSFSFGPADVAALEPRIPSAPAMPAILPQQSAPASAQDATCEVCGAANPSNFKFCPVCGASAKAAPTARAAVPPAAAPPPRAPVAPTSSPVAAPVLAAAAPAPIAPISRAAPIQPAPPSSPGIPAVVAAPVVPIAEPHAPRPMMLTCARCGGQCDSLARFCKYCGAPLAGSLSGPAPTAPRAPVAEPIAAPAPLPKTGPHPLMPPAAIAAAAQAAPAPSADVARVVQALGAGQAPTPDTVQTRAQPADADANSSIAAELPAAEPRLRPPAPPTPHRAAATARLVVVVEDGSDGKAFPLASPETIVGRTEGDILLFDDPYVSPRHARLHEVDGVWHIADLRSVNGVYLKVRGKKPIESGDLILLGSQVLQFQLVSEEERHLGPVSQQGTRVFGSKPVTRLARLDQRSTSGLVADVYYVYRDETVLGREVGDVVFTADAFLSRRHATLRRDPATSAFSIEDLDSSNGTYLALRRETALSDGDRLRIGQHLFRFERRAPVASGSSRGDDRPKGGNANGGAP